MNIQVLVPRAHDVGMYPGGTHFKRSWSIASSKEAPPCIHTFMSLIVDEDTAALAISATTVPLGKTV